MSRRYTYSRTIRTSEGEETFTAEQFDSFDEAIRAAEKGIYERKLFLKEKGIDTEALPGVAGQKIAEINTTVPATIAPEDINNPGPNTQV